MTRHITVKELRPNLPRVMDAVDKRLDRYIVTKRGLPVAVIISPDDYEGLLETIDILQDKPLMKRLKRAETEARAGKTRTLEEIERSFERA